MFEDKQRFEDELHEKEARLKELLDSFSSEQKRIESLKAKVMENLDTKFEKMQVLSDVSANIEASSRRKAQIEEEVRDNIHELDKERMTKEDANILLTEVTSKRNKLIEKVDKLSKDKLEYTEKLKEYDELIKKADDELRVTESRYKFLVETENEFEGYNRAVKEALSKCQKDKAFGSNIYGALANLIDVPSKYETSIEMVLGASIQNIVTETENDAKRAIEFLKSNNFGRASFLPISAVKGGKLSQNFKNDEGVFGIASDLVNYDKKYENIVQNLLGRTVIVSTMDDAVNISKKYKYSFRVVTLDGDVVNSSGQMTGGSVIKKTTSLLSRGREIKELEVKLGELRNSKSQAQSDLEKYQVDSKNLIVEFEDVEKELQQANVDYARESQKMSEIDNNIERYQRKISLLNGEKEKLLENL